MFVSLDRVYRFPNYTVHAYMACVHAVGYASLIQLVDYVFQVVYKEAVLQKTTSFVPSDKMKAEHDTINTVSWYTSRRVQANMRFIVNT